MVELNDILQWKSQYGDIYQMEILGQHFIFRPLGREEYKGVILMDLELGEFQEAICFQAIIYPDNYDYTKGIAGVAEILSDGVLDVSGLHLGQAKELLDQFRDEMYNYDYQVDVLIHEAFREFTLEEIASWPVRRTMFYLSRSEWILRNLKGVQLQTIDEAMQEEFAYQMEMEQQMQQQSQQPNHVPQNEMPPEFADQLKDQEPTKLAGGEQIANFGFFDEEEPAPEKKAPEGGIQSEEELLRMLAGTGKAVTTPSKDMKDRKELGWFNYMDELKGEFD